MDEITIEVQITGGGGGVGGGGGGGDGGGGGGGGGHFSVLISSRMRTSSTLFQCTEANQFYTLSYQGSVHRGEPVLHSFISRISAQRRTSSTLFHIRDQCTEANQFYTLSYQGSVHRGTASRSDCGRAFPGELRVGSFPWWLPTLCPDTIVSPALRICGSKVYACVSRNLTPILSASSSMLLSHSEHRFPAPSSRLCQI